MYIPYGPPSAGRFKILMSNVTPVPPSLVCASTIPFTSPADVGKNWFVGKMARYEAPAGLSVTTVALPKVWSFVFVLEKWFPLGERERWEMGEGGGVLS